MKQRLIQMIAKFITMAMVAVLGYVLSDISPEQQATVDQLSVGLAAAIVGIGTFVTDILIHKAQTGGVMKPAGQKKGA